MKKTLVVFGNKEPNFVAAQVGIRALQQSLSFAIEECLSKQDFFAAIRRHQPELLIVDCHGGIDANLHQSYLMMGDDKLTGDDIVSEGIRPQLVFLSACNTFPTYNTINSIANAFFEAGSYAVTSSYMQLEVNNATLLYGRLLRNLSEAANRYLHFNWLAFISHLMRTSYIQAPMLEKNTDTPPDQSTMDALIKLTTDSMRFGKRREIYSNLNTNSFTKSMGVSYQYIIPHYLMYSTLGRADMIRFQVAVDEVGINVPVER